MVTTLVVIKYVDLKRYGMSDVMTCLLAKLQ
jgi:hypothetical protein